MHLHVRTVLIVLLCGSLLARWPRPVERLHYDEIRPFGPFSPQELAFALDKGLLSETDVARILDDQIEADNKPFETWEVVERLRASRGHDRSTLAEDVRRLDADHSAGDPGRRWYLIVARDALVRYDKPDDVIKVLDQIWDDFGRPREFVRVTAIGNPQASREILEDGDF